MPTAIVPVEQVTLLSNSTFQRGHSCQCSHFHQFNNQLTFLAAKAPSLISLCSSLCIGVVFIVFCLFAHLIFTKILQFLLLNKVWHLKKKLLFNENTKISFYSVVLSSLQYKRKQVWAVHVSNHFVHPTEPQIHSPCLFFMTSNPTVVLTF